MELKDIIKLENEVKIKQAKLVELDRECNELHNKKIALMQEIFKFDNTRKDRVEKLKEIGEDIKKAEAELKKSKAEGVEINNRNKAEVALIVKKEADIESEKDKLATEREALIKAKDDLKAKLLQHSKDMVKLNNDRESLEKDTVALKEKEKRFSADLKNIDELKTAIDKKQAEQANTSGRLTALSDQLTAKKNELAESQNKINASRMEIADRLVMAEKAEKELAGKIKDAENSKKTAELKEATLNRVLDGLQKREEMLKLKELRFQKLMTDKLTKEEIERLEKDLGK